MKTRIEICGGIASGKSTLAKVLGQNGYTAIFERFDDNPFVKSFYQSTEQSNSFETEVVFTLLHYNQIKQKHQEKLVISDYSLLQDYCYGMQNLNDAEKAVFENLYNYLLKSLPPVDLIIYLKCGVDCLQKRIYERNREMEMSISRQYLQKNIEIIEYYLLKEKRVLEINSEKYDFRTYHQKEIVELINKSIGH